jgi:hypothetical protein
MVSAFCVGYRFVSEGAKRRLAADGARSEGHITETGDPYPAWARLGELSTVINFRFVYDQSKSVRRVMDAEFVLSSKSTKAITLSLRHELVYSHL